MKQTETYTVYRVEFRGGPRQHWQRCTTATSDLDEQRRKLDIYRNSYAEVRLVGETVIRSTFLVEGV